MFVVIPSLGFGTNHCPILYVHANMMTKYLYKERVAKYVIYLFIYIFLGFFFLFLASAL